MVAVDDTDAALAWRVEEACSNAYPCWREIRLGGWLLRAAGGATRRINSINPLWDGVGEPEALMASATVAYGGIGQPVLFRIPDMITRIDVSLEGLGFVAEGSTATLMAEPGGASAEPSVSLAFAPAAAWHAAWHQLRSDLDADAAEAHRRSIDALLIPAAFACRRVDGEPVSVAYAALHRGIAVLESVVTHPAHRGRGHAGAVVRALMNWCVAAGAEAVCLQVAVDNAAAQALYRSAGFHRHLYRYHYRRGPAVS